MAKLQEKGQWAFIIGAYIAYRIILKLSENYPVIAPFMYPLIVFYIIFAFSTWIAIPISNLFLRFHPLGKLALDKDEILASNIAGLLALLSISSLIGYYFSSSYLLLLLGAFFGIMLIPVGGLFATPEGSKARKSLTIYTLILAALGIGFLLNPVLEILAILFMLGIFFYGFVVNYLGTLENRKVK